MEQSPHVAMVVDLRRKVILLQELKNQLLPGAALECLEPG